MKLSRLSACHRNRTSFLVTAMLLGVCLCRGDGYVFAPIAHMDLRTDVPIPISPPGGRYQQVYDASLFTNLDRSLIYLTSLQFSVWTNLAAAEANIQINLSTCARAVDGLSLTFADNVGTNDTKVYGPATIYINGPQVIYFTKPFRYDPSRGNLLVDIRVFSVGNPQPPLDYPSLWGANVSTDAVSRVWGTNVTATVAMTSDTMGPYLLLQFSPIPSLLLYSSYFGTPTNFVAIEWPTQPSVFQLQNSLLLGGGQNWQPASGGVLFSNYVFQRYYFPANTAGPRKFYRLVWPGGP